MSADPERVSALVAKFKSQPGVVAAGWTAEFVDMERAIRFSATEWRNGDKINKDKVTDAMARALAKPSPRNCHRQHGAPILER